MKSDVCEKCGTKLLFKTVLVKVDPNKVAIADHMFDELAYFECPNCNNIVIVNDYKTAVNEAKDEEKI